MLFSTSRMLPHQTLQKVLQLTVLPSCQTLGSWIQMVTAQCCGQITAIMLSMSPYRAIFPKCYFNAFGPSQKECYNSGIKIVFKWFRQFKHYSTFHNKYPPGGGAREKQNPPPGVRGGYCPASNVLEKAAPGVSRVTDQKDPLGQGWG